MKFGPRDLRCEKLGTDAFVVFFEELNSEPSASMTAGFDGLSRTALTDDELLIEFVAWLFWFSVLGDDGYCKGRILVFPRQEYVNNELQAIKSRIDLDRWANSPDPEDRRPSISRAANGVLVAYPKSIVDVRYLLTLTIRVQIIPLIGHSGFLYVDADEGLVASFATISKDVLIDVAIKLNVEFVSDSYSRYLAEVSQGDLGRIRSSLRNKIDSISIES